MDALMKEYLGEHHKAISAAFEENAEKLAEVAELCAGALKNGGKILFCGNGGSAADAQHIAAEFTGRLEKDRRALAAVALTTDTPALTAIGNDYGFEQVFSRQVAAFGQAGDVLVGITTSGNSANVLEAFVKAKEKGVHTVAFTGRDGGKALQMADHTVNVPHPRTMHIQESHIALLHLMCLMIEKELKLFQ